MNPVPSFFQTDTPDARKEQVAWLKQHLKLTDDFFAAVLNVDPQDVADWLNGTGPLATACEVQLAALWRMFLHLFSFANFDYARARDLLVAESEPSTAALVSSDFLPWAGSTMQRYLHDMGPDGVEQVTSWLMSFRFQDRNAVPQHQHAWASLTPQP